MVKISSVSIKRLEEQGYCGMTSSELSQYRFGIRFAYFTCASLLIAGQILKSQTILLIANGIAFFGMMPPYHPLDYFYNYGLRYLIKRPKLPHRPNQGRFACAIATILLGLVNYFFYSGKFVGVYIVSSILLTSAFLVSLLDLCIPSKIYNAFHKWNFGRPIAPLRQKP